MKKGYYACSVCCGNTEPCLQIVVGSEDVMPSRCDICVDDDSFGVSRWCKVSEKTILMFLENKESE